MAICLQEKQVNRRCHLYCAPYLASTSRGEKHLCKIALCWHLSNRSASSEPASQTARQILITFIPSLITTVLGLITNNDETAYRKEIEHLATLCIAHNLAHNIKKTKKKIVGFRKKQPNHIPLFIGYEAVQWVSSSWWTSIIVPPCWLMDFWWGFPAALRLNSERSKEWWGQRRQTSLRPALSISPVACGREAISGHQSSDHQTGRQFLSQCHETTEQTFF